MRKNKKTSKKTNKYQKVETRSFSICLFFVVFDFSRTGPFFDFSIVFRPRLNSSRFPQNLWTFQFSFMSHLWVVGFYGLCVLLPCPFSTIVVKSIAIKKDLSSSSICYRLQSLETIQKMRMPASSQTMRHRCFAKFDSGDVCNTSSSVCWPESCLHF